MTKSKKRYAATSILFTCLLFQGCSPREEDLWGLGSFVFLVFVIILILSNIAPRIQEIPSFQTFVAVLERFSVKAVPVLLLMAIGSIIYGAYSIASNEDRSRQDLFAFVGAVILYLAVNIRSWATAKDGLQKRNHVRLIGLSLSFLTIYCYLILGAPNLSL